MRLFDMIPPLVCAAISAVMLWAAWRLADGEMFYACCGVFTAAFWGALAGCMTWGAICNWQAPNNLPPASTIYPARKP